MYRTQILIEPEQHKVLVEIAHREKRSLSDVVREMLQTQLEERKKLNLELAAKALLADYQSDPDRRILCGLSDPLVEYAGSVRENDEN